jgi:hypothetical protein
VEFYFSVTDISGGVFGVQIGENAENEVCFIKSFSVFEWTFWDILFF